MPVEAAKLPLKKYGQIKKLQVEVSRLTTYSLLMFSFFILFAASPYQIYVQVEPENETTARTEAKTPYESTTSYTTATTHHHQHYSDDVSTDVGGDLETDGMVTQSDDVFTSGTQLKDQHNIDALIIDVILISQFVCIFH